QRHRHAAPFSPGSDHRRHDPRRQGPPGGGARRCGGLSRNLRILARQHPGHYRGYIRANVTEGAGAELPSYRRMAMLALGPLMERAAERLAPGGEGFNLPQAEQFTAQLDIPVISVGGFHTQSGMEAALNSGRCDAVSAARAFIANPYLFQHIQTPL